MECLFFCLNYSYSWYGNKYYKDNIGIAMGAKIALNVANLFTAQWKDQVVFRRKLYQLLLYWIFIDYITVIWEEDEESHLGCLCPVLLIIRRTLS